MSWTPSDIPDQRGKVAVVTGANTGLGLEASRELARKGATVVLGVRNVAKGHAAVDAIKAEIPAADVEVRRLDLGSLASVRQFAEGVMGEHPAIDILLNNAGIMATPPRETSDGFESQVGTNHLGHFALTAALMPALERAPAARIVTMTSVARFGGNPLTTARTYLTAGYGSWASYGHSKLANYQFGIELARRLTAAGSSVSSLVAHPGLSRTGLQGTAVRAGSAGLLGRVTQSVTRWIGMDPASGTLPQLRAATDPNARNGEFYGPRWTAFGAPVMAKAANDPSFGTAAATMWQVSEEATGASF